MDFCDELPDGYRVKILGFGETIGFGDHRTLGGVVIALLGMRYETETLFKHDRTKPTHPCIDYDELAKIVKISSVGEKEILITAV